MCESTVEISADAADVARHELDVLIAQTGGDAGFDIPEYDIVDESMTPLTLLKVALENEAESLDIGSQTEFGRGRQSGLEYAVELLEGVADVADVETNRLDPLQDDIFRARDELAEALGGGA